MPKRWLPEDFDVAGLSERNRRAWAEQEAQRAAKQIGKFASGVPRQEPAIRAGNPMVEATRHASAFSKALVKATTPQADSTTDSPQGRSRAAATGTPIPCLVGKTTSKQPKESAIQKLVGLALELHPRMAWHARMNSGAMTVGQRFIRFAFKGCSDFIGQTTDGRFVAVEVKRPDGKLTEDQISFLGKVSRNGGIAFVARSADDVAKGLG